MTNEIVKNNQKKLEELNIQFEHLELENEAHNIAEIKSLIKNQTPTDNQITKTIIMISDDCPIVILIPGDKKIDFRKLKEFIKAENMRMAEYDEVEKIGSVGAIFPFTLEINVYIDKKLIETKKTIINMGTLKDYAIINGKDFEKINNLQIGDFT